MPADDVSRSFHGQLTVRVKYRAAIETAGCSSQLDQYLPLRALVRARAHILELLRQPARPFDHHLARCRARAQSERYRQLGFREIARSRMHSSRLGLAGLQP